VLAASSATTPVNPAVIGTRTPLIAAVRRSGRTETDRRGPSCNTLISSVPDKPIQSAPSGQQSSGARRGVCS